jgi:Uma2 family endonuclease
VIVYRTNNTVSFLHENEELSGEDVLPNFRLPIEKIFGNLPEIKEN